MDPLNNDMAQNYLNGLIDRERLSSQEQRKHYETNKHLLEIERAEDEFRSWTSRYHKNKHRHSRDLVHYAKASYDSSPEPPTSYMKKVGEAAIFKVAIATALTTVRS
jgi:Zn-finger nucleic acid-binding protein